MTLPSPPLDHSLLVRTDFADDDGWAALCELLQRPVDGLAATLVCVSDRAFERATPAAVARLADDRDELMVLFLADAESISGPEHTVVVVELDDGPTRTIRVTPQTLATVQANLEIGNMDFEEFADAVDADGVFRGFGRGD
jgi:hypothetical protein